MPPARVLLLNPPSPELVIRDYYCSKTSKSGYIFAPTDLLMLSGRLAAHFELGFIDAVADRLDEDECERRVLEFSPDAVVFLTGAVSWPRDLPFLERLKRGLGGGAALIGTGDIFQEDAGRWLEEFPFIDAAIHDFTNEDALQFLLGNDEMIQNAVYRRGGALRTAAAARPRRGDFDIPMPRHELFENPRYRFGLLRRRPFATVLTDFGCPYPCTFCVMSGLGSKFRSVDSVLEELRYLKARGVKELLFMDQTWGVIKERNLEICRRMRAEGLDFGWIAFARADAATEEALEAWRLAGCHTLIFGIEFGDPRMLEKYRKGSRPGQILAGLSLARRLGIRTVGTFMIGIPEDTRESVEATIRLACDLPIDFASFNVAVPRHGTGLRAHARREGLIDDLRVMDQNGARIAMPTHGLDRSAMRGLRRKAILSFYLRPSFLWRRLRSAQSLFELRSQFMEGLALVTRA